MRSFSTKALTLPLCALVSACSMIPTYQRPADPTPATWPQGAAYLSPTAAPVAAPAAAPTPDIGWKAFFRDPELQRLIGMAYANNRDLRTAALRVDAYRAQYRIKRADLLPTLNLDAVGTRQRLPGDLSQNGAASITSQYSVGPGILAYELDFFGRVRSLEKQALEQYLAQEEAQRAARLSLTTEVANAWLTWRSDQSQLALTQATLHAYEASVDLVKRRMEAGVASELEFRQASSALESARAEHARFTRLVAQDANALQLLIGAPLPPDLAERVQVAELTLPDLPVGLPATVLQRRPDIQAAEHALKGANANIGAARAAFFPNITLTASAGSATGELAGLWGGSSGFWSFAPLIRVPIFNAGRLAASLDYSEVQKDIQVADYERAIQTAFREVSDGLAARTTFKAQVQSESDLVQTNRRYLELADQQYQAGIVNFLTVLDAQRALLKSQQLLIVSRLAQLSSEVTLYKALGGGGWA